MELNNNEQNVPNQPVNEDKAPEISENEIINDGTSNVEVNAESDEHSTNGSDVIEPSSVLNTANSNEADKNTENTGFINAGSANFAAAGAVAAVASDPFIDAVLNKKTKSKAKIKKNKKGMYIFISIMAVCIVLAIISAAFTFKNNNLFSFAEKTFADNSIAVIRVSGQISQQPNEGYNHQYFLDSINKIQKDKKNRGILLYIDSPGGAVYESDELYLRLMKYKEDTNRPIYVSMSHLAASGGYYLSVTGNKVYANRNTLTGSIGVIAGSSIDLTGLFDKYGIKMTTFTAGKNKNMLNYNSPVTDEQRQIMQSVADECYNQFVGIVAKGRGLSVEKVKSLADGRVYTALQAKNLGLIDDIATFEQVKDIMKKDLNLEDTFFDEYSYQYTTSFLDVMGKSNINPLKGYTEFDFLNKLSNQLIEGPAYLADIK